MQNNNFTNKIEGKLLIFVLYMENDAKFIITITFIDVRS